MKYASSMRLVQAIYAAAAIFGFVIAARVVYIHEMTVSQILTGFTLGAAVMGLIQMRIVVKCSKLTEDMGNLNKTLLDHNREIVAAYEALAARHPFEQEASAYRGDRDPTKH
jgi:hypothetical protein